jgi:shikimate kinase/3-dehydroquinate synthase
MTIPDIFRDHGEAAFRASEREILKEFLARDRAVIATGGGAVVGDDAWSDDLLGRAGTFVFALEATPETILARLRDQAKADGEAVERPMLAGNDPLVRIRDLKRTRQAAYDEAHLTVSAEGVAADSVTSELAGAVAVVMDGRPLDVRVDAVSGTSDVLIAPGLLSNVGTLARERWPRAQRAWVVTDEHVGPLHAAAAEDALRASGFDVATRAVPAGEGSKSLGTASALYDWVLGGGIERGDIVVALGGGMVGDLAGFIAATALRGVGLVQIPTSLLAAVDSSVGGKTGINHAAGKNLIGAFLQPRLVVVDTELLRTLPARELRSGWAEVVKHAIIQSSTPDGERGDLATVLERNAAHLRTLDEPAVSYLIWRNIALKAAVVAADERESGIRAFLNFGHTLGHGIEAADYRLLHGEAVALGMRAEAELGVLCETCGRAEADRISGLISAFGLPDEAPFDVGVVLERMKSDKKRVGGRQRFVLPRDGGGVVIRDDVPDFAVVQALESVKTRI